MQIVCGDFDSAVVMVNGVGHSKYPHACRSDVAIEADQVNVKPVTFMNSTAETMMGYKLNDVQQCMYAPRLVSPLYMP